MFFFLCVCIFYKIFNVVNFLRIFRYCLRISWCDVSLTFRSALLRVGIYGVFVGKCVLSLSMMVVSEHKIYIKTQR